MYDLVNNCVYFFILLSQGYYLQYFYGSFLESRGRAKKWNNFCVLILYVILKSCIKLHSEYGDVRTIEFQLSIFGVLILLAFCFYKAAKVITGFLIITFMAVCQISLFCAIAVGEIIHPLFEFWNWCMKRGYITSADVFDNLIKVTYVGTHILLCIVAILIPAISFKKIVRNFREKEYAIDRAEFLFILSPSIVGLLICVLLQIYIYTQYGKVYQTSPFLILIIPAILLFSLLFILYDIKLFQDMIDRNREKNSRIILEKEISNMQEQIVEMEHIYSGVRGVKHDMRNTLTVIMQLADKSGTAENIELQTYLSELNETFDKLEYRFKTGNTVVDTLLNMKYHEIMRSIPDLQMNTDKLLFPENLMIQSYDIGVILGNALDNAIEACKKQKEEEQGAETFINLSSFFKGKMFFIEIENSFSGEVVRKGNTEFPVTTKADKKVHGIGLTNIKNTAEKYHGAVDWSAEYKIFTLSVMLKNEQGI